MDFSVCLKQFVQAQLGQNPPPTVGRIIVLLDPSRRPRRYLMRPLFGPQRRRSALTLESRRAETGWPGLFAVALLSLSLHLTRSDLG